MRHTLQFLELGKVLPFFDSEGEVGRKMRFIPVFAFLAISEAYCVAVSLLLDSHRHKIYQVLVAMIGPWNMWWSMSL